MRKCRWLYIGLAVFVVLAVASTALAAHWTEIPFPSEYYTPVDARVPSSDLSKFHGVFDAIKDSNGNIWAVTRRNEVLVLRAGSSAWENASAGLPISDIGDISFWEQGGKVFLSSSSYGTSERNIYVRGPSDSEWRLVPGSSPHDWGPPPATIDGQAWWMEPYYGVGRIDPVSEEIVFISQGLPEGSYGSYGNGSNVVATNEYVYVGIWETSDQDPTFSRVGVFRLKKGDDFWQDTGLEVSLTDEEKALMEQGLLYWGVMACFATDSHVLCNVEGSVGSSFSPARLYLFSESSNSWEQIPTPTNFNASFFHFASRFSSRPIDRGDNKFYLYNGINRNSAIYSVFNPQTIKWEENFSERGTEWAPVLMDMRVSDDLILVPRSVKQGFVSSVPLPTEISKDPAVIGTNLFMALIFATVFGFTSTLFNSTIKENHHFLLQKVKPLTNIFAGIKARAATINKNGLKFKFISGSKFLSKITSRKFLDPVAIVIVAAFIYGFLDPGFSLSKNGAVLFISLLISVGAVTYAYEGVQSLLSRRRYKVEAGLRLFPAALAIAIICVIFSRLMDFQPGYLYGFAGGMAFLGATEPGRKKMGHLKLISSLTLLLISLTTWFLAVPVTDALQGSGTTWLEIIQGACIGIFVTGLEGLLFSLVPLSFMDGEKIFRWNKWIWLGSFSLVAFLFWHVLLNKNSKYAASFGQKNVKILFVMLGFYILITVGSYVYFRNQKRLAGGNNLMR